MPLRERLTDDAPAWGRRPIGRPLVIAHRGASAAAPENTLAAFRLARSERADGVELDPDRGAPPHEGLGQEAGDRDVGVAAGEGERLSGLGPDVPRSRDADDRRQAHQRRDEA